MEKKTVGVVGLGYVGLPLAVTFAQAGHTVLGFDIDVMKLDALNRGKSSIPSVGNEQLTLIQKFTSDFSHIASCDAVIVAVPTPITPNLTPDVSAIEKAWWQVRQYAQRGTLVVLESTTYPGTTAELAADATRDGIHVAFSPEREDPGNLLYTMQRIPKVVGADTPEAQKLAVELYQSAFETVIPVSSSRVAESTKLLENIFRSVNIALVNELKMVFSRMGIDIWEVLDAAETKPFGFMRFDPGPGIGGHCIPADPYYLAWKAREFGACTRFIELAGEINESMPSHVVTRTIESLSRIGESAHRAFILVIGIAYKPDINDVRESPGVKIIKEFARRGISCDFYDPYIPKCSELDRDSISHGTFENIRKYDAVVIATNHAEINFNWVVAQSKLVIDTRHCCPRAHNVVPA